MNVEKLMDGLNKIYGPGRGAVVYMTIIPGILADFDKMLAKAGPDSEVTEEYRLEDGRGAVFMKGKVSPSGEKEIEAELVVK